MYQTNLMFNIFLLAFLWGPSFLFIKIAVQEVSPISLVTLRIGVSALLLLFILKIKKVSIPLDPKLWFHCFFMGAIASSLPFVLYGYSLEHIDSIFSALINSITPVSTVILASIFLKEERLTKTKCLGVLLGISGFLILCSPALWHQNAKTDLLGMLYSFIASFCYAIGMVYARKNIKAPSEPLVLPTLQLFTSLLYLIPLSLWLDPPISILNLSSKTLFSIFGLAIMGTGFAFIVYYRILFRFGATALSTVTYLLPLFSTGFGVLFSNEKITFHFCLAALCIVFSIMVINNALPAFLRFKFSKVVT